MQVLTLKFDEHPEELYLTYSDGMLSVGSDSRAIMSGFIGVLEPDVVDVVETEPIVEPESEHPAWDVVEGDDSPVESESGGVV